MFPMRSRRGEPKLYAGVRSLRYPENFRNRKESSRRQEWFGQDCLDQYQESILEGFEVLSDIAPTQFLCACLV